mmetsp:Transcript_93322/g.165125  ORF Transcript_93322/g.165125 Transcript_93322/m.165125 type:complete len:330 (+) Transcript_93322:86-1075(+)
MEPFSGEASRERSLYVGLHPAAAQHENEDEYGKNEFVLPSRVQDVRVPPDMEHVGTGPRWGHHKLAMLVEYVEEHCQIGSPESIMNTIEMFATGVGTWLKVAGGAKAPLIESAYLGRPLLEDELMIEFGTFIGYTSMRLSRRLMMNMGGRHITPFKGPRMISIEVDPINAFVARHIIDLSMLLCYMEVWTGQIKDVIPRIIEVWGERSIGFAFLDYKGSRYHVDFAKCEQLDLLSPFSRLVADNTISPGAPLLLWNLHHSTAVSHTLWALQEFLEEAVEDWMVVFDYETPSWGPRKKHAALIAEEKWEEEWAHWDGVEWKEEWNEEKPE